MKRLLVAVIVLVILGGAAFVIWGPGSGGDRIEASDSAALEIPPVKAPTVVVADAKVTPVRNAALSFAASGVVAEILVREGERVEAGAVLLRLDDARQRAAVELARAQLERAEAHLAQLKSGARAQEIEAAEAAVDEARAQVSRVQAAGPPLDVAIAEAELRRATAQLDLLLAGAQPENVAAATAEVAAARASLLQAEVALAETELRAPFAGVVASIVPNTGEYVVPGSPVAWLADDSAWRFETEDLTEIAVVRVQEGDAARLTVDAFPGKTLAGRVVSIKPMGENRLGDITYKVIIEPDEHDPRLRWNMTASVTIGE